MLRYIVKIIVSDKIKDVHIMTKENFYENSEIHKGIKETILIIYKEYTPISLRNIWIQVDYSINVW